MLARDHVQHAERVGVLRHVVAERIQRAIIAPLVRAEKVQLLRRGAGSRVLDVQAAGRLATGAVTPRPHGLVVTGRQRTQQ